MGEQGYPTLKPPSHIPPTHLHTQLVFLVSHMVNSTRCPAGSDPVKKWSEIAFCQSSMLFNEQLWGLGDVRTDGWTERRTDGQMDGQTEGHA